MKIFNQPIELIVKPGPLGGKAAGAGNISKLLGAAGLPVEDIVDRSVELPAKPGQKRAAKSVPGTQANRYVRTRITDAEMNPWDAAHLGAKALGSGVAFVEPDMLNEYVVDRNVDVPFKQGMAKGKKPDTDNYDPDWQPHKNTIWHLGDDFSQLAKARAAVAALDTPVRIAHIDTGFNSTHAAIPDAIRCHPLQRSFIDGEEHLDARDRYIGGTGRMPGHGTGTLALLAGGKMKIKTDDGIFNDFLGGAYFAEVFCLRISPTVILFKTSAFAEAVNYLAALCRSGTPVHVVSMSMGGAPSRAWTEAVNKAYEAGIVLVTASGNNFGGVPTRHVVYPARYNRVLAASGVTYDRKPYFIQKLTEMQGCFGPEQYMDNAISAFTPNMPWAYGDKSAIDFSGAGTSSATPQVAAAAAIYYRKYAAELNALPPWQRAEAIRYALRKSASKKATPINSFRNDFGNGILQAYDALSIPVNGNVQKTPEDTTPWFPILTTMFKAKPGATPSAKLQMFNTELEQLIYYYPDLGAIIDDGRRATDKVGARKWKAFTEAVLAHPSASTALKKYLMATHGRGK
jgi:subtilisin family serine protease